MNMNKYNSNGDNDDDDKKNKNNHNQKTATEKWHCNDRSLGPGSEAGPRLDKRGSPRGLL